MQSIKISIIIVAYKAPKQLFACLTSIYKFKPTDPFEVIVVDNNEKPNFYPSLLKEFPNITYIKSKVNCGYGTGNNIGANVSRGKYLLILNPDTNVTAGAVNNLKEFLHKNRAAAIVAPVLLNSKGETYTQLGAGKLTMLEGIFALSFLNKLFPDNPISRRYYLKDINTTEEHSVNAVPGSAFMIRKDIFEKIGGFDEKFFMYFEESDLGKCLKESGYDIWIIPEAKVIHEWGKSTTENNQNKKIFMQSRMYYFRKHYGVSSMLLVEVFARFSKYTALTLLIILCLILYIVSSSSF